MIEERKPDESITIQVDGHNVVAYSYGVGDEVLFCINGGPGLPCDYVRDSHSWLADKGYDQLYGARPLGRIIQEKVKQPLADELLFGKLAKGGYVVIDVADGKLTFDFLAKE